ncbi:MAG: histidine phosphatase family protein [Pseudomonadota bacterium]
MTQIALIRHYPTAWNKEARLQGQTDIPLTDAARETLTGLKMPVPWGQARLIASSLSRAVETARILADGRPIVEDRRLMELSWGDWEGHQAKDLLADAASGFRPTHEWDADTKAPGGESRNEAWARTQPALADIAERSKPAVLVTHKALMRIILGVACNWQGVPEIKRGRLYPLTLRTSGLPRDVQDPVRLVTR